MANYIMSRNYLHLFNRLSVLPIESPDHGTDILIDAVVSIANFTAKKTFTHISRDIIPHPHPLFKPKEKIDCPYCNLVTMIAWYIFIIPELVKEAAVIFKVLKAKMEKQEFI